MNDKDPKADQKSKAISVCEDYLRKQRKHNIDNSILASENIIIDRLLARRLELLKFYNEIYSSLETRQWERVLSVVLYTAAFWNPESAQRTRDARNRLVAINEDIEKQSRALSKLIEKRYALSENYGIHSYDKYHIAKVIDDASKNNDHYHSFLKEPLQHLVGRFDLKYWPSIAEIIDIIARDAQTAEVYVCDSVTDANISSPRNSLADYFNAFFQSLEEEKESSNQFIPDSFYLTDESIASMANCALDLADEDAKDAQYVKRFRQRARKNKKKMSSIETDV